MVEQGYPVSPDSRFVRYTALGDGAALAGSYVADRPMRVAWVGLHVDDTPSDSEEFTVSYASAAGRDYDVEVLANDLSADSVTDLSWVPEDPFYLMPGDAVVVAYANTGKDVVGVTVLLEVL